MSNKVQTPEQKRSAGIVEPAKNPGPFIARVVKHADPYYLGGLEVELLKTTEAGNAGETLGQTAIVYYASPFYGVTGAQHLGKNDNYSNTQKSYGFWMVPPDPGTLVLPAQFRCFGSKTARAVSNEATRSAALVIW